MRAKFVRGQEPSKSLDIGEFRDQIDWDEVDNMRGLYKVIVGDANYVDDCFVVVFHIRIHMVKNWEGNDGAWSDEWVSDDNELHLSFEEFLRDNEAFNIIKYKVIDRNAPPGYENIEPI